MIAIWTPVSAIERERTGIELCWSHGVAWRSRPYSSFDRCVVQRSDRSSPMHFITRPRRRTVIRRVKHGRIFSSSMTSNGRHEKRASNDLCASLWQLSRSLHDICVVWLRVVRQGISNGQNESDLHLRSLSVHSRRSLQGTLVQPSADSSMHPCCPR